MEEVRLVGVGGGQGSWAAVCRLLRTFAMKSKWACFGGARPAQGSVRLPSQTSW